MTTRTRYSFSLLLITLLSLLAASCGSSRKAADQGATLPADAPAGKRFEQMVAAQKPWTELSVPVTVSLRSPKSIKLSGTLTMKKDEYIHLSVRFLGMEVASAMVTRDSIFAREKLHRNYVAESLDDLLGSFPATVGNLQSLLMGRMFILGENGLTSRSARSCTLSEDASTWTAIPRDTPRGLAYGFTMDNATNLPSVLAAQTSDGSKTIVCTFDEFAETTAGMTACTTGISAAAKKIKVEASLDFNYSKARWDGVKAQSWSTPKGYKRISAAQLLKSLSSL